MILKNISLHNFRQFYENKLEFSTDTEKNVTLIFGNNGAGKTTIAQAFSWCLYGKTRYKIDKLVNMAEVKNLEIGEKLPISVELEFVHGDQTYTAKRTQIFQKTKNGIRSEPSKFELIRNNHLKSRTLLKGVNGETEVRKILSPELSQYFFFDGERMDEMSKEIGEDSGGKRKRRSKTFQEAVSDITGFQSFKMALEHLGKSTQSTTVIGRLQSQYSSLGEENELEELQNRSNILAEEIEEIDQKIEANKEELAVIRSRKNELSEEIKQFETGKQLQKNRTSSLERLNDMKENQASLFKETLKTFNNNMISFFSLSLAKKALEIIKSSGFNEKELIEISPETILRLINRKICICGNHLEEGSESLDNLQQLLNELSQHVENSQVNSFIKKTEGLFQSDLDLSNYMLENSYELSNQDGRIKDLESEILNLSKRLEEDDVEVKVQDLDKSIRDCEFEESKKLEENSKLHEKKGNLEQESNNITREITSSIELNKNNKKIQKYQDYAQELYNQLEKEYETKKEETRLELQNSINEIFKSIYEGDLILTIDENYHIDVKVKGFKEGVDTSTAQSIAIIFAFIASVIKLAKENSSKDELYSEPYPLVMDAPLSSFDKKRIKSICDSIPNIAEQVIFFIKDTDGEIAKNYLQEKVNKSYFLKKINEVETEVLEIDV